MRSAPLILIGMALFLTYGTAQLALQQEVGWKEIAFLMLLPAILVYSAVQIWRIQRREEE